MVATFNQIWWQARSTTTGLTLLWSPWKFEIGDHANFDNVYMISSLHRHYRSHFPNDKITDIVNTVMYFGRYHRHIIPQFWLPSCTKICIDFDIKMLSLSQNFIFLWWRVLKKIRYRKTEIYWYFGKSCFVHSEKRNALNVTLVQQENKV